MKKNLKRLLESKAPFILDAYRAVNNRRVFGRRFKGLHDRTQEQLYGRNQIKVLTGPFKGLRYYNEVVWGPITPKWLGSYEIELWPIIEEIVARDYMLVIDVGCAEGYYAVGLAYRLPRATILAYDSDFISRRQTKRLARLNQIEDRVHVFGYCAASDISRQATKHTLIVCDIEGFERSLLDPASCAALLFVDILVEVHEGQWKPSTLDLLKTRFNATHTLKEVTATDREDWINSTMSAPDLSISQKHLREAADEHRTNGRKWLWMKTTEVPS